MIILEDAVFLTQYSWDGMIPVVGRLPDIRIGEYLSGVDAFNQHISGRVVQSTRDFAVVNNLYMRHEVGALPLGIIIDDNEIAINIQPFTSRFWVGPHVLPPRPGMMVIGRRMA